jgi:hypothetical protein
VPFTYRYFTPASYPRLNPRLSFYSFSRGNVHFLVLDSESPSHPGSQQHSFAAAALAAVDRSVTPWIVVGCGGEGGVPHRLWCPKACQAIRRAAA